MAFSAIAVHSVRIVTDADEALPTCAGVDKAIWASSQDGLVFVAGTAIELVVVIAVLFMRQGAILSFTVLRIVVQGRHRRLSGALWPHAGRNGLLGRLVIVVIKCRCSLLSRIISALKLSKDTCQYYKSLVSEKCMINRFLLAQSLTWFFA